MCSRCSSIFHSDVLYKTVLVAFFRPVVYNIVDMLRELGSNQRINASVNRRDFLRLLGGAAASGLFTACGPTAPAVPNARPIERPTAVPRPTFPTEAIRPASARLERVAGTTVSVSGEVRRAFEQVTNTYTGRATAEFQRLRVVAFSETSTQQLVDRAKNGNLIIKTAHPALIVELEYLQRWAQFPSEFRMQMLDMYAEGIIDGLLATHDPNNHLAVGLEAGHMSVAPPEKINAINADRKARSISRVLRPTEDTGASAKTFEGAEIVEKQINYQVAQLVALKIIERYPKWQPVLNSKENGFPAERFSSITDTDTHYIRHRDSLITLRYKWERLAELLAGQGVPMVRFAIHLDGGPPGAKDGSTIPQNSSYKDPSTRLARGVSSGLQRRVLPYVPDYANRFRPEANNDPFKPYWMIDDYNGDKLEDIAAGRIDKVDGATSKLLAEIRLEELRGQGRAPFIPIQGVPSPSPSPTPRR